MRFIRITCSAVVSIGLTAGLAGCGGGSSKSGGSVTGGGGGGLVNTGAAEFVYVIQQPTGAAGLILQFPASSSGSVAPTATLTPGSQVGAVATDQLGNVYVDTALDIREYVAGATGTAMPIRSIPVGATSGIYSIDGLAVSPTGEIVIGQDGGDVDEWSATQNGAVAPSRRIPGYSQMGGGLSPVVVANQVAVDGSDNIYVAPIGGPGVAKVVEFGPSANGNVTPIRTVGGLGTVNGLTVDSAGNIYTSDASCTLSGTPPVLACSGTISEYAAGAIATTPPMRTISGSATGLASLCGIEVDAVGNIFVLSFSRSGTNNTIVNPTVLKFAASSSGNVAPTSSFTSPQWTSPAGNAFNPSLAIH